MELMRVLQRRFGAQLADADLQKRSLDACKA